jgi:uncharacterized membrane protein YphA (DoxX/SURF4 family)
MERPPIVQRSFLVAVVASVVVLAGLPVRVGVVRRPKALVGVRLTLLPVLFAHGPSLLIEPKIQPVRSGLRH